jgi:biotin-(acetyl-CoA carboxylase) ligase
LIFREFSKNFIISNKNVINWTSLKKITGKHFDRNEICVSLINNIIKDIEKFSILGLEYFLSDWNNHDYLTNKKIVVKKIKKPPLLTIGEL